MKKITMVQGYKLWAEKKNNHSSCMSVSSKNLKQVIVCDKCILHESVLLLSSKIWEVPFLSEIYIP